ncbi:DsbA family protein [Streptomyces pactum]|uniref:2-hydroxychromene-2-carboxylate isomerase n=1 Tax=Streptomyces pactum TaxID=68249 RepID=A0ABS0NK30_9ACTN|nr:DsbA family protein [Streptomyces pactum]MBH5335547.1 DsbA family protein [Streptomyces pactum]
MSRSRPRWYFSFSSPYSWLAHSDLVGRYSDVADVIDWLPFWEPDEPVQRRLARSGVQLPYVPMSDEKRRYVEQDVRRLARERGLEAVWPPETGRRWEVPHLAFLVAQEMGRGREFTDLVYRACWQRGEDVCDPRVIAVIGAELGLDGAALGAAPDDPAVRQRGLEALFSLHRDGVFGVPYFIDGAEKFWGVDRLAGFAGSVRAGLAGWERAC